jgi:hypothetical protein
LLQKASSAHRLSYVRCGRRSGNDQCGQEQDERMIGGARTLKAMFRWPGFARVLVALGLAGAALSAPPLCERAAAADTYPSSPFVS